MPTERADAAELLAGRYRLEDVVARGGMGTVWRAVDNRLQRAVAIKEVVLGGTGDASTRDAARARFLREAHAAASISHPSVVAVYDVIDGEDRLYLVMELVDGETLTDVVAADGPLTPVATAELGLQLCDALEAAHAQGIVHRDLKPSNVLLFAGGRAAKLADFGIAASIHDPRITATGLVLGSPSFMAPEQAHGHPASPATDLWGLGATLYYAVEGVGAFARDSAMAAVHAVVNEPPRAPEQAGPLRAVLLGLLAKHPGDRLALSETRQRLQAVRDDRATGPMAAAPVVGEATVMLPGAVVGAADPTKTQVLPKAAPPAPPVMPARAVSTAAAAGSEVPPAVVARPAVHSPRRAVPAWVLVALVVVAVIGLAAWALARDGGGAALPADATTEESTPPPGLQWSEYTDPVTGFAISYPSGWEITTNGTRTDFTDPETGAFLRVDWTDEPGDDPVAAWKSLAKQFAKSHDNYEQIRIEPTEFQGLDAAEWEFTFDDGNGAMHAMDLGMVTEGYGFALFFQTPADRWDEFQPFFTQFQTTFVLPAPPPSDEPRDKPGKGNGNGRGNGDNDD